MGKNRKRFTRDLLDSAKEALMHYVTPSDKAQMERTLSLIGIVGTKPHINDVMPQIMERIEEEERMSNIEMARRWARGNDWSRRMIYDCMGEDDYLSDDEITGLSSKQLRKLNKKLYNGKTSKRGGRGKGKKKYDKVEYTHYNEDMDDFWNHRATMYANGEIDDEDNYEDGYKCIKFYPDIENELSAIEFHSIKDFNDFCDKKGYLMGETDIENVKNLSVVHCCLDPIDLQYGDYAVITDKSYGGLYWTVSDDLPTDKVTASSNNLVDKN